MAHVLPPLPYPNNALEPHLDVRTTEIHHDKHHAAYVNNLNTALDKHPEFATRSLEELLADLKSIPEDIRTAVRNNAGGTWNHNLYWDLMTPGGSNKPVGALAAAIEGELGGLEAFKEKFSKIAVAQFASGWGWLYVGDDGKLAIASTPGHDSPLMRGVVPAAGRPVLVVDVWEHAYYLKFQNRRADFVAAWWNVINWTKADELYRKALGK